MAETVRTFVAVRIPATDALREILSELSTMGNAVKPVSSENLHTTLKFLGPTECTEIPGIIDRLNSVVRDLNVDSIVARGMGAFPHAGRPSVVWIGFSDPQLLVLIAKRIESSLKGLGFVPESRSYHPHLTVARVKRRPPPELKPLIESHENTEFGRFEIKSVDFVRSELQSSGAKYTLLHSALLNPSQ